MGRGYHFYMKRLHSVEVKPFNCDHPQICNTIFISFGEYPKEGDMLQVIGHGVEGHSKVSSNSNLLTLPNEKRIIAELIIFQMDIGIGPFYLSIK